MCRSGWNLGSLDLILVSFRGLPRNKEKNQVARSDLKGSLAAIVEGINGDLQKRAADHIKEHHTFVNDGSSLPDATDVILPRYFSTGNGYLQTGLKR
ncbi:MAG: hypothetical protein JXA44_11775 [Methanospirillaceae archaeon]|nr:hypothetical protein [Methanospirillaceae archaeon]